MKTKTFGDIFNYEPMPSGLRNVTEIIFAHVRVLGRRTFLKYHARRTNNKIRTSVQWITRDELFYEASARGFRGPSSSGRFLCARFSVCTRLTVPRFSQLADAIVTVKSDVTRALVYKTEFNNSYCTPALCRSFADHGRGGRYRARFEIRSEAMYHVFGASKCRSMRLWCETVEKKIKKLHENTRVVGRGVVVVGGSSTIAVRSRDLNFRSS